MELPLVRADDVLAQPTRARLFSMLSDIDEPVTTDELADRLGLHPNGVRNHLIRLEHEGLLIRQKLRHGPGRPRDGWRLNPAARDGLTARAHAYENLARWLARSIEAGPARLQEVEATGVEIGREQVAGEWRVAGIEGVELALRGLGFRPRVERRGEGRVDVYLEVCPYVDAAVENTAVVCALHRGMTQGMVDAIAPDTQMDEFVPADPARAGCLIGLRQPAETVTR
jgi:predicted ArsR family transcriptional regulator